MHSYESLITSLEGFAERAKISPLTLGVAVDTLDEAAYALIALILALPFLQPIPLGPLTVIGGLTFATLGWQLWRGNESPILPQRIRQVVISEKIWRVLAKVCRRVVMVCRKVCKPRYAGMVQGRSGQKRGGMVLIIAGLLMAIPFPLLPLNNMLPAFAILLYCIGEFEQDGLMLILAFVWLLLTATYFTLFFIGLYYLGTEAVMRFFSFS